MTTKYEIYGSARCPYTSEMRDWLEFKGHDYTEYDVEADPAALARLRTLCPGQHAIPVLVQDGCVAEIGWRGRSCVVAV